MQRNVELEATIVAKYAAVSPVLDERSRRRWAAAESVAIGYGGDALVSSATGLARETLRKGRREITQGGTPTGRIRRPGAGRPRLEQRQPGLLAALEGLVDPLTRGDPTSPLRWTCKSRAKLASGLAQQGWRVSSTTVGRLLHQLGYRLQSARKRQEGTSHPDRNAQFEHINATADSFLAEGQPVISVDTKKKERIRLPGAGLIFSSGNGRKWTEPSGKLLHDEVVPAQICRHRSVGLCGCEEAGNEGHEGRLAGRRTCAEHVAVESAHGRLAVPLSPRQLVGASSAATVGPAGSLAGRWVWRLPRRTPVPRGGARPRGSRRRRRRHEDTRRGPTPRTAASCLVACPPLAAKPTGRGLGRRRDGAD